jgi:hypothetical protein
MTLDLRKDLYATRDEGQFWECRGDNPALPLRRRWMGRAQFRYYRQRREMRILRAWFAARAMQVHEDMQQPVNSGKYSRTLIFGRYNASGDLV